MRNNAFNIVRFLSEGGHIAVCNVGTKHVVEGKGGGRISTTVIVVVLVHGHTNNNYNVSSVPNLLN